METKDMFRAVMEASPVAILALDLEGRITIWNNAAQKIFGWTEKEVVGKIPLFVPKAKIDEFHILKDQVLKNRSLTVELKRQRKDGKTIDVSLSAASLFDPNGKISGIMGILTDITENKQAENRMKKINECFLGFSAEPLTNMNALVALCGQVMNADCGLYNRLDKGLLHSWGQWNTPADYDPVDKPDGHICYDVINRGAQGTLVVRDLPRTLYMETDPNVKKYGLQTYIGHPVKLGDRFIGSLCVVYGSNYEPTADDLRTIGILASAIGIQEQRREIKDKLEAEKERLSVTLTSIGDAVISTDTAGKIISFNKAAGELTGWKQKEAIGKSAQEVLYLIRERTQERCCPVTETLNSKAPFSFTGDALLIGKEGEERIVTIECSPIKDKCSETIGVVLSLKDVTELRTYEEERLRTQKLESIGMLAGGIAHDFNNILMGILGNISMAKTSLDSRDQNYHRLGEAEKATLRARDLTQQLLTFSKGGIPIKKTFDIAKLLEEMAGFALSGSNVKREYVFQKDLWPVMADEGQVSQVIHNLIINAKQAMPKGGTLTLRMENVTKAPTMKRQKLLLNEGHYVKLSVIDQGTGIAPEHMKNIFDPYFTTKPHGSGLGLATVYSIVKNHGGHVFSHSKFGKGATFEVYLPASPEEVSAEIPKKEHTMRRSGRILVMDDDRVIRETVSQMLEHLGYQTDFACDGEEAINCYLRAMDSENTYDAIIMDLTIPGGVGGKEAMERIREIDPSVRAIVSSGYSIDSVMSNIGKYGFKGSLCKPYTVDALNEVLENVLGKTPVG